MTEQPINITAELRALIEALQKPKAAIPPERDLWDAETIAAYLKVSARQVAERYACRPDFPRPILLPSESGSRNHRRWKAKEVMEWAESLQERRRA